MRKYWKKRFELPIIFLIALLLRIPWSGLELSRDSVKYLQFIEVWSLQEIPSIIVLSPPLYLYICRCFSVWGLPVAECAVALNIVLGAALPVILYCIAEKITNNRLIITGSALLLAFAPSAIEWSSFVQREAAYLFLCGSIIWLTVYDQKNHKYFFYILWGCVLAIAVLCRYEALELYLFFWLWQCGLVMSHKRTWARAAWAMVISGITACIALLLLIWAMGCYEYMLKSLQAYSGTL